VNQYGFHSDVVNLAHTRPMPPIRNGPSRGL
jgi:hypothetical protein